jgi:hypothetical protein
MASVIREIELEASQDDVWAVVGDFTNGPRRFAPGVLVDCHADAAGVRAITFADGTIARERLIARDDDARRIVWGWVDDSVTHDNTSMQVFAEPDGRSRLVWIHDTLPDEHAGWLATAMDQLAPVFQQTFRSNR